MSSVETVNVVDPRIEPRSGPVYMRPIAPKQNQFYKLPASGLSDSYVTFNNIVVLGRDRAYLDTFELEIEAQLEFNTAEPYKIPPCDWVFDSFPFNKCCEEARVNINGTAFFSNPLSYLRAKEHYWSEKLINESYENICPCNPPHLQNECGVTKFGSNFPSTAVIKENLSMYHADRQYNATIRQPVSLEDIDLIGDVVSVGNLAVTAGTEGHVTDKVFFASTVKGIAIAGEGTVGVSENGDDDTRSYASPAVIKDTEVVSKLHADNLRGLVRGYIYLPDLINGNAPPTRLGYGHGYYMPTASGLSGSTNNVSFKLQNTEWRNDGKTMVLTISWREPVFCSPFSSRVDSTYGRPLYNITSMDIAFNLQNLGNMIRVAPLHMENGALFTGYTIHLNKVGLCYQVETLPPSITPPPSTVIPYRRFVPYITDFPANSVITADGGNIEVTSGVYTMNEIPTAIWVFAAPTLNMYQTNPPDENGFYISNKQFGFLKHISISMANTTQLLDTAEVPDLYRIAKANGCQESFREWAGNSCVNPRQEFMADGEIEKLYDGPGSVLRLIPGTDLVLPDQDLIPGANANNMVFQVRAEFDIPPHGSNINSYALWILFEYVGVATLTPGQGNITMNPMGTGSVFNSAPVISAAPAVEPSTPPSETATSEGSGWWDTLKNKVKEGVDWAKKNHALSKILHFVPQVGDTLSFAAEAMGYGAPHKRSRYSGAYGGAVMGLGDFT